MNFYEISNLISDEKKKQSWFVLKGLIELQFIIKYVEK